MRVRPLCLFLTIGRVVEVVVVEGAVINSLHRPSLDFTESPTPFFFSVYESVCVCVYIYSAKQHAIAAAFVLPGVFLETILTDFGLLASFLEVVGNRVA